MLSIVILLILKVKKNEDICIIIRRERRFMHVPNLDTVSVYYTNKNFYAFIVI